MTFFFIFTEIRYRLLYVIGCLLTTFLSCYFYSLELVYVFARPFLHSKHNLCTLDKGFIFTNLSEAFHTTLKICFVWSFIFLVPVILYHFWCFLSPSWYFFERKRAKVIVFSAIYLTFLGGISFYFYILPEILDFLLNFKISTPLFIVQLEARIDSYVKTSIYVFLIVEYIFQMPLFFFFLYRSGYIDSNFLSRSRKMFVLFFVLLAALLTPPDPLAEFFVFSIFWLFFEFIIWVGFLEFRKEKNNKNNILYKHSIL